MRATRLERHGEVVVRCYVERPPHVDAMFRRAVDAASDAVALADGDVRLTYAELDGQVRRLAAGLAAHGVGAGDRLAVMLQNGVEAVLCVLAAARLGAIVVPIGSRLRQPEITFMLADARPKSIVYDVGFEGELPDPAAAEPPRQFRFRVGHGPVEAPAFADLLRSDGAPPPCPAGEDDVLAILYTSGTTGRPKGATLTHLGAVHSCLHWAECLGLGRDERALLAIPWSHVAGLCGVVLRSSISGGGSC